MVRTKRVEANLRRKYPGFMSQENKTFKYCGIKKNVALKRQKRK